MQLIQSIKCRAFTLVEMLVALAVSSIIIIASYASYEMVATQYKKNMDIADMHTSGRAIMRIIERDIRMAGFEYRDKDAKVTYGSISSPLTIKDSGNKCCDEVTVIYDYFDEESKKAERIRIRYWAGPHTSNKGSRHRLYKQKDILGQNKKILAKPKLGSKDVMADYIEDLQIVNIVNNNALYLIGSGSAGSRSVQVIDTATKTVKYSIRTRKTLHYPAMAFGSDGLLYLIGSGSAGSRSVQVIDTATKTVKYSIRIGKTLHYPAMAFGSDGLLYLIGSGSAGSRSVQVIDTATKTVKYSIRTRKTLHYPAMAFGSDGLLYLIGSGSAGSRSVQVIDTATKTVKYSIRIGKTLHYPAMAFGSDGLLYLIGSGSAGSRSVQVIDTATKTVKYSIRTRKTLHYPAMAFGSDGLLYLIGSGSAGSRSVQVIDTATKTVKYSIRTGKTLHYPDLAIRTKRIGQESLVTINLTLRTKNQYGKDRVFKKKDYHGGNFKIDKTDKYKRDTFSSTVLVRNLAL